MTKYKLLSIWLMVFSILIFFSRLTLAELEVIETYDGFVITWKGPKSEKAKVELPAFCLELEKDLPNEETNYSIKGNKLSEKLKNILKVYRFLKDNVQLRHEFLRHQKEYAYLLERAELATELQWSRRVREKISSSPILLKNYKESIKLADDLLSQKALRTAAQHAIWAENSHVGYEDALERIFEREGDVNSSARDLMKFFYRFIAPYTQLILEASGSSAKWIEKTNDGLLIDPFDPISHELFLNQRYEDTISEAKKILNSGRNIKEKLEAQFLLIYCYMKIGSIKQAKRDVVKVLKYIDELNHCKPEKIIEFKKQIKEMQIIKAYLEDRMEFEKYYKDCLSWLRNGEFQKAKTYLGKALNYLPDHPEANYLMGLACYNLGELDNAIASWQKVSNTTPCYSQWNIQSRLALLSCYREMGRQQELQSEFQKFQELLQY